ncbi:S8 family peptidase [Umezawaea beigongshangensis]|uniref:S8 family peptidase n=1 Tax=Umezawaea beigongshangensis TaxID=2780383 RepID=UPI0018F1BBA6|nr:S8 family serine peptidase [Umezawaea beigongshangensis]
MRSDPRRRRSARWGATALAIGLVTGSAGTATAAPDAPAALGGAPGHTRTVTLITGDRVLLDDEGATRGVLTAPGRERTPFSTRTENGHQFVVPADAARLVASGALDPRLFDVTELVRFGYEDRLRDDLPLIVTPATGQQLAAQTLSAAGVDVRRELPAARSLAVTTNRSTSAWEALTSGSTLEKVWLDGKRTTSLDRSVPQIGAPAAWEAGHTGEGVRVAVLDTGVDETHPDLVGQEVAAENFTGTGTGADGHGHGTHVASTVAGTGAHNGGKYRGVASGADLIDGKVLTDGGSGQESWIIAGMEWAVAQGADVVNMSLGGGDSPGVDPMEAAVNRLSESGVLFVVAAGNSGAPETIGSPGSADAALTVGAVDRDDSLAPFSSRGPRTGDGAVKPDITAPGVEIAAARSSTGVIGTPVEDGYVALSGTSMATPHVAGAAAILAQQHPDWPGSRIKAALMASAKPNPDLNVHQQGAGRVDVAAAVAQTVTAEPASVSLGTQQWPHGDDEPVTREITYRNTGTEPLTLDLAIDATGPEGDAAPGGLLSVSPERITVPAGGEATAVLTGDTSVEAPDGFYSGTLTATGGDLAVRTPLAIDREVESYSLTVNTLDREGEPVSEPSTYLVNLDTGRRLDGRATDGSLTVRAPKGEYFAASFVVVGETAADLLISPSLVVAGDTEVTFDGREARPVSITGPDPAAQSLIADIGTLRTKGRTSTGYGAAFLGGFGDSRIGQVGPAPSEGEFLFQINQQDEVPSTTSTYRYAFPGSGELPDGFTRVVRANELAEVRRSVGVTPKGARALLGAMPSSDVGGWGSLTEVPAPGTAVDHVTTATPWSTLFLQVGADGQVQADISSPERTHRAGGVYEERVNHGIFSPSNPYVKRLGDDLRVSIPLFTDSQGGAGFSAVDSARTTVYRGAEKIGETADDGYGEFVLPAGRGQYRLETEATRSGVSELSTKVTGSWTFRSGTVGGEEWRSLPVSVIRFDARLDADGSTRAGRTIAVPLSVQQQEDAESGRFGRFDVQVSFDDGATWSRVPVVGRTALVRNPAEPGFASLKVSARDSRGNETTQQVIRAYKIAE